MSRHTSDAVSGAVVTVVVIRYSWRGEKSKDLLHNAVTLVGLKQELRMRSSIDHDERLWLARTLEMLADLDESRNARCGRVAARNDEQLAASHAFGMIDRRVRQQHEAVDLARGHHCGVGRGATTKACADDRDARRSGSAEIPNGTKHVVVRAVRPGPSGARLAASAKVYRDDTESRCCDYACLWFPAPSVEATAMGEDDASITGAVNVSDDDTTIGRRERDAFLGSRAGRAP